ncbi:unnamed protein product [Trichogramma brassicae]|uniref:RPN1 N-terminal domain-containing protein n=1 Tax=Trichogramma brassicae TaxID=86971 RepID=A0A6H5IUX3_9HYME|nr:unnamed protein product [Trichogramma brassicae]
MRIARDNCIEAIRDSRTRNSSLTLSLSLLAIVSNSRTRSQSGTSVNAALRGLRKLMRMSTTSMTAVPKPLKYLKDSYGRLKQAHRAMPDDSTEAGLARARLADIVSVLALAAGRRAQGARVPRLLSPGQPEQSRRLGPRVRPEARHGARRRVVEHAAGSGARDHLLPLAKKLVRFDAQHNAEIQACDLALEIDRLDLLVESLDKNNYSRVCLYLASTADYTEDLERREILRTVVEQYMRFNEPTKAILTAMQLPDHDLVNGCFDACQEPLLRKQLAYALARLKVSRLARTDIRSDADELERILGNGHVNAYFQQLIRELDILEPKSPDEIYGSLYEPSYGRVLIYDSARANLAASFASAFVHAGFGRDKLMTTRSSASGGESAAELNWVYKNKEHAMMSATASLGLLYMWDCDGGLVPIDKFLYASDDLVKSGALLAIGLVNCGVRSEYDPAMALLGDHVMSTSQNLRVGSILGLGLAYAATKRPDLNSLLCGPLNDRQNFCLWLWACCTWVDGTASRPCRRPSRCSPSPTDCRPRRCFRFARTPTPATCSSSRSCCASARSRWRLTRPTPKRPRARTCFSVIPSPRAPLEGDTARKKKPSYRPLRLGTGSHGGAAVLRSDLPVESRPGHPRRAQQVQPRRRSERLAQRHLRHRPRRGRDEQRPLRRDSAPARRLLRQSAVPSVRRAHSPGPHTHGKSTRYLRFLESPTRASFILAFVFLLYKGTITLQPLKYSYKILDQASLAGLLVVLVSFLDCNNLILGKNHYLMYCLALAMEPRWLVTLNEDLKVNAQINKKSTFVQSKLFMLDVIFKKWFGRTIHDTLSQ